MIIQKWRSSPQDVRAMSRLQLRPPYNTGKSENQTHEKKIETKRVKYNIDKINQDVFQLELKNRFSVLYNEEQELDIELQERT